MLCKIYPDLLKHHYLQFDYEGIKTIFYEILIKLHFKLFCYE